MDFGVSTLALHPAPLETTLEYIEGLGINYCEIINEYPIEIIDDIISSHTLKYILHAPISDINIASPNQTIRKSSIMEIKSSLELAAQIGSDKLVLHPGSVPFLARAYKGKITEYNLNSLKELKDYADDLNVTLCLENMPNMEKYLYKNLEKLYSLVNELEIMATLDVGHAHTMGYTTHKIKIDLIGHVHLSDNNGLEDSHEALGTGSIDFPSIFKSLEGYGGILTIEVKSKEELLESLTFLEKLNLI
ncbi:MAG TPA: sugar phosphate isomerase/epimerase family protein [Methanothermobacter sp.]|nr:xylose isomerase domain protein TIM barrel [Methanothermobacter sp. MT-2]HHW05146.1 sugar phosphate isomerase/epimerase [Methanothermobacter sp.]HOK73342.1 sugar phosphate isomerase/epimerase family protein [Methanothermobacter sp.]HOL69782.1 sugar phosphate isomerase/epimerase family protein [Methanothermobacter sp.]HPQ05147.1 sugar phosphate isomerase/epimerase family protein [Methanothermobacter sp.]